MKYVYIESCCLPQALVQEHKIGDAALPLGWGSRTRLKHSVAVSQHNFNQSKISANTTGRRFATNTFPASHSTRAHFQNGSCSTDRSGLLHDPKRALNKYRRVIYSEWIRTTRYRAFGTVTFTAVPLHKAKVLEVVDRRVIVTEDDQRKYNVEETTFKGQSMETHKLYICNKIVKQPTAFCFFLLSVFPSLRWSVSVRFL